MTQINLRFYDRLIKTLIEQDKASEAVEHCRHILMSFPKHIQTYRLFGEASLELNRYEEAAEIFKRLLSSIPDDYIAHIGMSVILEEFGKPDSAIWHMARAYELQPYNVTIQNELRRLYNLRDGIEIRKLSLTRPALARLYARGGLFPQAIAELNSILVDHPERIDLVILLANLHQQTGAFQQAVTLASSVLLKLPYCLEAIRLVVITQPDSVLQPDINVILQKYHDLDPYTRFLDDMRKNAAEVPDNKVVLDWLARYPLPENFRETDNIRREAQNVTSTPNSWVYEEDGSVSDAVVVDSTGIAPTTIPGETRSIEISKVNLTTRNVAQTDPQDEWVVDSRDILK